MTVTSTDTVHVGAEHLPRFRKAGIVISALVTAFLVFDAAGKLSGVPQVKEGTPPRSPGGVGLTREGGHLTGGTAGPAGRLSVCRASVGSTPRSFGSRLPAW